MAKATNLIKAYTTETIPHQGGFIVTAFFIPGTAYGIYEVTAYRNVKDIFRTKDGIIFKTDGNRMNFIVEPPSFSKKHIEPYNREEGTSIPYRFEELTTLQGKKGEKILIAQEPKMLHSSFTVIEKDVEYFSFIFHLTPDVYVAMRKFIGDSIYNDCHIAKNVAVEAATEIIETVKQFTIFNG